MLLFRNKAELQDLRNLELSISTEGSRIKLGSRLRGKERREYQSEIDEATERKSVLEEQYEGRRARLPVSLRKLTNGYEMRTYWFEVFECVRKILLILIPIFFEQDSPEQLTVGLIICFITWGAYMVRAPARQCYSPPSPSPALLVPRSPPHPDRTLCPKSARAPLLADVCAFRGIRRRCPLSSLPAADLLLAALINHSQGEGQLTVHGDLAADPRGRAACPGWDL